MMTLSSLSRRSASFRFVSTSARVCPTPLSSASTATPPSPKSKPKKPKDPVAQYYSESLNLPKTAFPLRAEAAKREKLFWKRTTDDLYEWQAKQTDRPLFVLHDGPPYANGSLHCGHALNKITKDIINRSKLIQGHRIHYVPGFDTHGLPLELKALSALKKPASSLLPQEIRAAARREAEKGIELQTGEFKSFAVMGEWEKPYKTMDWSYEKRQLQVVRDMVGKGLIVTHNRPTLYSPSSRTALAEAELEYRDDHVSRSVYVAFPVKALGEGLETAFESMGIDLGRESVSLAAWTTTPWTLPSNLAIAVSPTMEYSLVRRADTNALLVVAAERIAALAEIFETSLKPVATFLGSSLLSTTYTSVLDSSDSSASAPRPVIPASYVTATTGTGLVHTSPAHGIEDFESYRSFQSSLPESSPHKSRDIHCAVDAEGRLSDVLEKFGLERDVVERLKGKDVLKDGSAEVIRLLEENKTLLREVEVQHKFPYDWRTKKPVIFRASSQWFANLENVKEDAVKALESVDFFPSRGARTLEMYVRGRSEWCISRQRAWGVPIPVVYSYPAGSTDPISASTPHLTPSSIDHIISVFEANGGTDYWWKGSAEEFVEPAELEQSRTAGLEWRKGTDTLDVWFDSGCSWTLLREAGVSSERGSLADVYFEGSDQHRGWFQSSLLTRVASADQGGEPVAPYKDLLTHGMVLDDKGRKMSKSLGNVISPNTVIQGGKNKKLEPAYGTDLLRIWVASVDSSRDVLIGPGILAQTFDGFRKIRNTARFMLGNLGQEKREDFAVHDLGLVERYMLHELHTLDRTVREAFATYQFNRAYQALAAFSNSTLSSFYFDVTKDTLYADSRESLPRRHVIHTLQHIFDTYLSVLAPLAPLLAEEIYHYSLGASEDPSVDATGVHSVFERVWPEPNEEWSNSQIKAEMDELLALRTEVLGLLEEARNDKKIGSSAEARVVLSSASPVVTKHHNALKALFIVSEVSLAKAVPPDAAWQYASPPSSQSATRATVLPATMHKCVRCWQHSIPPTPSDPATSSRESPSETATPTAPVCSRCADALTNSELPLAPAAHATK
ncbi:hypothetical protein JCM10212_003629 [Sporobolomyces blumeae]